MEKQRTFTRVSENEKQIIRSLWESGLTMKELADRLGRSAATIENAAKSMGLPLHKTKKQLATEYVRMHPNQSIAELTRNTGLSVPTVVRIRRSLGISKNMKSIKQIQRENLESVSNAVIQDKDKQVSAIHYEQTTTVEDVMKEKQRLVEHPEHYNDYDVEVVEMMRRIWGDEEVAIWYKLSAFKYRMRAGHKPGNSIKQDLDKEAYCMEHRKELESASNE